MRVFLTGATGFIGSHVARALVARGEDLCCLCRPTSHRADLEDLPIDWIVGDLTDRASLRRAMTGAEVVFHCAADYRLYAREPAELYRSNVDGTQNVLALAAELGVRRVVYTSSVGTLALGGPKPANENARAQLADMVGDYKRSKFLAERVVESWIERGLPIVVVSPSTPIGERDAKPTPTGRIVVDFLKGRLPAYVDTGLNLVDVHDVALGHLLAAERGRLGESYILGAVNLTLQQMLELLGRLTGKQPPRLKLPHWIPLAIAHLEAPLSRLLGRDPRVPLDGVRMSKSVMFFDPSKAVRELGFPQSPIEPAFERAVSWFIDHDYAPARAARVSSPVAAT
ncbi:MAG TPA: hopanoid-associated sugar epimerase [Polyangia bacterium]|jgi:dihydroflavonol-4-reductase|nr:hopanoid-associated sugar epimerase [Polyangia bacterium]